GMIQRGQYLGFALEARHAAGICGERRRKNFDRHVAIELGIVGTINLAHSTRAELGGDAIMRDCPADHFLSPASQFTQTFNCGGDVEPTTVSIRKRLPSAVTSYSK